MRSRVKVQDIYSFFLLLAAFIYSGRALYSLFLFYLFYSISTSGRLKEQDVFWGCILLGTFTFLGISGIISGKSIIGITYTGIAFIPFYIFFFRKTIYSTKNFVISFISVFVIVFDFIAIIQFLLHDYNRQNINIIGASINYLAALNNLYFIIAINFLLEHKKSIISRIGIIISVLFTIISLSRIAIAMLILNFILLFIVKYKNGTRKERSILFIKVLFLILMGSLCISFAYTYLYENSQGFYSSINSFKHYFRNIKEIGIGGSRSILWSSALREIADNFWCGTYSYLLNIEGELKPPHNFILEILLLNGLIGLILYLFIMTSVIKRMQVVDSKKKLMFLALCINYWGICILHPFITTSYLYNIFMGYGMLSISNANE